MQILCPVCKNPLARIAGGLLCPSGHRFDRAAKGYTNLLLSAKAGHGDNREMILARRRFLDGGFYAPLANAVTEELLVHIPKGEAEILDAGCGEGYYTASVARACPKARLSGIDVSKEAIRLAAGRPEAKTGQISLYVAGVYDLPFSDDSFDAVTDIFSPFAREEYLRVLKPGGILLYAIPEPRHLWELKSALYDTPYENEVAGYDVPGFTFLGKREVNGMISLKTPSEIADLFAMTPYYYRTPAAGRARLAALESLVCRISFGLLTYTKA